MAFAEWAVCDPLDNPATRWIARWRKLILCLPVFLLLLGFNGKWRVGLDSSIYRGLALSLAHGKGYTFGDWGPKQIYPGYPYLLAGIEKAFGPKEHVPGPSETSRLIGISAATTTSIAFNVACALVTLWLTDSLLRRRYPLWVATIVTCGVGTNSVFIGQAHAIMTDMPFLTAVMLALWGWDGLRRSTSRNQLCAWSLATGAGMAAAALLRPMFWILLIAWVLVCLIGLVRGPRGFYAICLAALLLIGAGTALMRPTGYENEALDKLPQIKTEWRTDLYWCLHDQLPSAVFGEQLSPFSILSSLLVLLSAALMARRHLLWVLLVFGTFAVTILVSDEPRYYMAILPILMLGWLLMTCRLARLFGVMPAQGILIASIMLVGLNNIAASVSFFIEQHHADFFNRYRKGEYIATLKMADEIRQKVRPDQRVLGPSGTVLSIFSGVHVYSKREVLPRGDDFRPLEIPAAFAAMHFDYVVFPSILYHQKEARVQELMNKHVILPRLVIATVPATSARNHEVTSWTLATANFAVPTGDWRHLPKGWKPPSEPSTKPAKSRKHPPATTRAVRKKKPATRPASTRPATPHVARPTTRRAPATTQSATTTASPH